MSSDLGGKKMKTICNCTLCGNINKNKPFKAGFICEDCIRFIRGN